MFTQADILHLFFNSIGYGLVIGTVFHLFRITFFRH